jgi:hypothetical protein
MPFARVTKNALRQGGELTWPVVKEAALTAVKLDLLPGRMIGELEDYLKTCSMVFKFGSSPKELVEFNGMSR